MTLGEFHSITLHYRKSIILLGFCYIILKELYYFTGIPLIHVTLIEFHYIILQ